MINDIFSYQKEIQFEGEIHNAVLVVQNFFNCDRHAALRIVDDLMNSRMRQFQHVVDIELPAMYEDFKLGPEARRTLDGYAAALKDWLAGILLWHQQCRRYAEADLLSEAAATAVSGLLGPTGLGTSAARPLVPVGAGARTLA